MKKTVKIVVAVAALSAISSLSFAATPGGYVGLGLGAGQQNTSNLDLSNKAGIKFNQSRSTTGLAGRIFGGYNFNEYVGIETGYAKYSNATTKFNAKNITLVNAYGSLDYKMAALDVVGKVYLPIPESALNLYGLGGFALVQSTTDTKVNAKVVGTQTVVYKSTSNTERKIRPLVGFGASYDIPQTQLTTSMEYSYLVGQGNVKTSPTAIPSAGLLTLNLAYNFG